MHPLVTKPKEEEKGGVEKEVKSPKKKTARQERIIRACKKYHRLLRLQNRNTQFLQKLEGLNRFLIRSEKDLLNSIFGPYLKKRSTINKGLRAVKREFKRIVIEKHFEHLMSLNNQPPSELKGFHLLAAAAEFEKLLTWLDNKIGEC